MHKHGHTFTVEQKLLNITFLITEKEKYRSKQVSLMQLIKSM